MSNRVPSLLARACFQGSLFLFASAALLFGQPTDPTSPTRLSSNENAYGFSPRAAVAMHNALTQRNFYNRSDVGDLIAVLADKEGVAPDYILPTPGSGPVLTMTALAYAAPGKNVVTTEMGYTQLIRKFEERGGEVKYAPLADDMGYNFGAVLDEIDANTVIVYVCNPNNPTGVLADANALRQFLISVPPQILVFVDEAYLELSDGNFGLMTMAPLTKIRKNMIVTRTFSKGYGMAGHRIGYGSGHPDVLEKIEEFYLGPPTYLSAIGAAEAVKDTAHLGKNIRMYQAVRKYTTDQLDKMGLRYAEPQGAFVYFEAGIPNEKVREAMLENGIMVSSSRESGVDPGAYTMWTRVSIGEKSDMDAFLSVLADLLDKPFTPSDLVVLEGDGYF